MQEGILCIFLKIWSFYPNSANFSCFVTLELIILVRAINKCFQILLKCKNILQTGNVNLTKIISKATLKYIEQIYIPALFVMRMTQN